MATLASSPIVAAAGGSFLLETRTPSEVFTPEDLTEEQRQIAATAARFAREEILPAAAAIEAKESGVLAATLLAGAAGQTAIPAIPKIHATFSVKDATSPIAHAEYSVDAGPWQYLEPVGRVSDSLEERYDFIAAVQVASGTAPVADAREHVLAVRVYDRYENVVAVKTVVR